MSKHVEGLLVVVAVLGGLKAVELFFGSVVAGILALVMLAWCLGVFWGAGDQIRKSRENPDAGDA
ncbi:hypothetical protein E4M02_02475 [Brevundimonas sp. S30B]|uniref:hypothetical protein n=1 Tax=unclassified Brevundimonas TaxID=2622653 RepID=UPI001071F981|nr:MULTISPECIES: hypothetical protein [unclassified Brevundimonas]QBX37244.1 hypothetical protein E4M01_05345 [Brevundimonas sp. MF30-B]TFW03963.1 hypothetical protein E4M02_02475 [Brevundimonas sp. S30B]